MNGMNYNNSSVLGNNKKFAEIDSSISTLETEVNTIYPADSSITSSSTKAAQTKAVYDAITSHNVSNTAHNDIRTQLASPFTYKGTVASTSNLPSSNNVINDTYFVEDQNCLYSWNGTAWSQSSYDAEGYAQDLADLKNDTNNTLYSIFHCDDSSVISSGFDETRYISNSTGAMSENTSYPYLYGAATYMAPERGTFMVTMNDSSMMFRAFFYGENYSADYIRASQWYNGDTKLIFNGYRKEITYRTVRFNVKMADESYGTDVFNALVNAFKVYSMTDKTLSLPRVPAPASVVGEEIQNLKNNSKDLLNRIKEPLLEAFRFVAWTTQNADTYYQNLEKVLTNCFVNGTHTFSDGSILTITDGRHVTYECKSTFSGSGASNPLFGLSDIRLLGDDINDVESTRPNTEIFAIPSGADVKMVVDNVSATAGEFLIQLNIRPSGGGAGILNTVNVTDGTVIGEKQVTRNYSVGSVYAFFDTCQAGVTYAFDVNVFVDGNRVV